MYQTNTIMEFLGVSRATVNRYEQLGILKARKDISKNRWVVEKEDLVEFILSDQKRMNYFITHAPSKRLRDAYAILINEINYKIKMKEEAYIP